VRSSARSAAAAHEHNFIALPAEHSATRFVKVDPRRRPLAPPRRQELPHRPAAPRGRGRQLRWGAVVAAGAIAYGFASRFALLALLALAVLGRAAVVPMRRWERRGQECRRRQRILGPSLGLDSVLGLIFDPLPEGEDECVVVLEVEEEAAVAPQEGAPQARPLRTHLGAY